MNFTKVFHWTLISAAIIFAVFWIYHIVECLRRKDFRIPDKIFWFILLLVPVLGLIMYRGIGNEFYKNKLLNGNSGAENNYSGETGKKRRRPRGGVKIELPQNERPIEKK